MLFHQNHFHRKLPIAGQSSPPPTPSCFVHTFTDNICSVTSASHQPGTNSSPREQEKTEGGEAAMGGRGSGMAQNRAHSVAGWRDESSCCGVDLTDALRRQRGLDSPRACISMLALIGRRSSSRSIVMEDFLSPNSKNSVSVEPKMFCFFFLIKKAS